MKTKYSCKRSRFERKRFSLTELLIVVAILFVLMTLLQPALTRAIESSVRIACANNIKQIGYGMMVYSENYDGWMLHRYRGDSQNLLYLGKEVYLGVLLTENIIDVPPDGFYCPGSTFSPSWKEPRYGKVTSNEYAWNHLTGGATSYSVYPAICSYTDAGTDTYASTRRKIHEFDPKQAIMADWLFDANPTANANCPGNHGKAYFNYLKPDGSMKSFNDYALKFYMGGWSSSTPKFDWFQSAEE